MAGNDKPKLTPPVGERDHVLGDDDAVVTLVEYGDYECRHCQQMVPIVRALRTRTEGRLRYVFRHFPLSALHPTAQLAAEAAEAAGAQGKFWEMHELLFEHHGTVTRDQLRVYAASLDLDIQRFDRELDEGAHAAWVRQDLQSGVRSGAQGTPSLFFNGVRYDGPWDLDSLTALVEKPLGVRMRLMFQQFSQLQASGGILLLLATVLALAWANSPWGASYFSFWETHLEMHLGTWVLSESLLHWVNDGLMVIFFFLVGLEIKREVLVGELASLRRAILPLMAAVGGMVLPALVYLAFNAGGPGQSGWGVPMATDIAFLLGLLTVLGRRVPTSLKVFFTAVAIADDLGALLVIALFYSGTIEWEALAVAAAILGVLIFMNRLGVRNPLPFGLVGVLLWLAFLRSGVHPTIAGVLLAMTIPARVKIEAEAFSAQCTAALRGLGQDDAHDEAYGGQQAAAQTLEMIAERIQAPLRRLERGLNPWVAYLIVPVFALANAGLELGGEVVDLLLSPVSLGIVLGLVLGKSLGISLFSWLAVRSGLADLPAGVAWPQLFAASWLGGIGFTMSLFIASSAFGDPLLLALAKTDILIASTLAAIIGFVLLVITSPHPERVSRFETAPSEA